MFDLDLLAKDVLIPHQRFLRSEHENRHSEIPDAYHSSGQEPPLSRERDRKAISISGFWLSQAFMFGRWLEENRCNNAQNGAFGQKDNEFAIARHSALHNTLESESPSVAEDYRRMNRYPPKLSPSREHR